MAEFFATGEEHVTAVLDVVRRTIDSAFEPTRALDFGCGTGRLAIPLAARCHRVVGVDISESMLAEARRNAQSRGFTNIDFVKSDNELTAITGTFDFVHSFIVFQHMPVRAGMSVLRAMLRLLEPGGVGALHFSYAREASRLRRLAYRTITIAPALHVVVNLIQRRPLRAPMMQMNDYDLSKVMGVLQRAGCTEIHAELTDHFGHLGALIYFIRPVTHP
ncbi:MAG TPA: methyltransferase domain-containing protein [Nocardioides sp.]|uniref:class I SAM-dependent methyltransferase n=1 Tax=Nocardioides sp. TaxID=35761 RepID=UPI002F41C23C